MDPDGERDGGVPDSRGWAGESLTARPAPGGTGGSLTGTAARGGGSPLAAGPGDRSGGGGARGRGSPPGVREPDSRPQTCVGGWGVTCQRSRGPLLAPASLRSGAVPQAAHPRSSVFPRALRGPAPCDGRGMRGTEPGVSLPNIYVVFRVLGYWLVYWVSVL